MKINVDIILIGLDGLCLTGSLKVPLSFKCVAQKALLSVYNGEEKLTGDAKFERYQLAKKMNDGGQIDFVEEELELLKKLIGVAYPPSIVGPVYEVLGAY